MLESTSKVLIAALLFGPLTACSDVESDGPSFAGYTNEGDTLAAEIDALPYTDPASLPTTGSAQYNGVMDLVMGRDTDDPASALAGDLMLDVSFAENSISGSVTDIVDRNNDRYRGSLNVEDVSFNRDTNPNFDPTYEAVLSGNVIAPTGADWDVDAGMEGDFFGSDHSHTGGEVSGGACSSELDTCVDLEGAYGARR